MPFPDTELLEYVNLGLQDPVASSALLTWAMQYVTGMMFVISPIVRTAKIRTPPDITGGVFCAIHRKLLLSQRPFTVV